MPYDTNGQPCDPDDNGGIIKAVAAVIACILLIAVCGRYATTQDAPVDNPPTYRLVLDCGNAAAMHKYGMPTKADVMEWHMSGRWAYEDDGRYHVFADLPGGCTVWDDLYKIEPNTVFVK